MTIVQTTVRLSDDLHYQAKVQAVTRKMTLNEFLVEAIEKALPPPKKAK